MKKFISLFFILSVIGCAKNKQNIELPPEDEFILSKQLFDNKEYSKAIEKFKQLIFKFPSSKWTEESQYYLAKSYFMKKDYEKAQEEYSFFIQTYQRSRFLKISEYEYCLCCFFQSPKSQFDQSLTVIALNEIRSFIKKYLNDSLAVELQKYEKKCIDKLVEKELTSAKLYIKMGKYESAIIYLNYIKENYPTNSYTDEVNKLIDLCNNKNRG